MQKRKSGSGAYAAPEDPVFTLCFDGDELVLDMVVPVGNHREKRTVCYSCAPDKAEEVRTSLLYFLGDMMLNKRLINQSDKLIPARPL